MGKSAWFPCRGTAEEHWVIGNELKQRCENLIVSKDDFVKMSFFALDFEIEMSYPLAPPQGWEVNFAL